MAFKTPWALVIRPPAVRQFSLISYSLPLHGLLGQARWLKRFAMSHSEQSDSRSQPTNSHAGVESKLRLK